jgi:hypothetical protein
MCPARKSRNEKKEEIAKLKLAIKNLENAKSELVEHLGAGWYPPSENSLRSMMWCASAPGAPQFTHLCRFLEETASRNASRVSRSNFDPDIRCHHEVGHRVGRQSTQAALGFVIASQALFTACR